MAIVVVLTSIAIPRFSDLLVKAEESATKGHLGTLRSALSIYYSDNQGTYPSDINALVSKYLSSIPNANLPPHP